MSKWVYGEEGDKEVRRKENVDRGRLDSDHRGSMVFI